MVEPFTSRVMWEGRGYGHEEGIALKEHLFAYTCFLPRTMLGASSSLEMTFRIIQENTHYCFIVTTCFWPIKEMTRCGCLLHLIGLVSNNICLAPKLDAALKYVFHENNKKSRVPAYLWRKENLSLNCVIGISSAFPRRITSRMPFVFGTLID